MIASRSVSQALFAAIIGSWLLVACGGGGGGNHDASKELTPTPVCHVVEIPHKRILQPNDLTYRQVVDTETWTKQEVGVGAALLYARGERDLGPYTAVVDHLIDRYEADQAEPPVDPPAPTTAVRRSADDLDGALAEGLCS